MYWDPIKWFNSTTLYACLKSGPGLPMSYVMVYFMFNELRWDLHDYYTSLDPIKWFNSTTLYARLKPGPGLPMSYVMVFFMFNELRWDLHDYYLS